MAELFIYYSLTGSTELVSKEFQKHGYDLRKVVEKKKMPKSFFFSVLSGGFRASLGLKGKLIDYDNNVENYSQIVIASPIWNGRFTPALNSILAKTDLSGKELTFIFCSGSGEGIKAKEKVEKDFPNAKIVFLKEPKKYPEELKKIEFLF